MNYSAVIEIPKGCNRRIHMRYDKTGFEDFGPIKEKIPVNDGVMPVHYGYIEQTITQEKDNVDVLIFSNKEFKTGDHVEVEVIGFMNREDGDHKIIAKDNTISFNQFVDAPIEEQKLIREFFGHKKEIRIETQEQAIQYIKDCRLF